MKKKQVRKRSPSIYYKTEMVKKGKSILWRAVEMPSKLVLKESFLKRMLNQLLSFKTNTNLGAYLGFHLSLIAEMKKKDY